MLTSCLKKKIKILCKYLFIKNYIVQNSLLLYTLFFRGHLIFAVGPLSCEIRKYSSLVKAESKIRENKNQRIAKIAQTRKLGDREKPGMYSI